MPWESDDMIQEGRLAALVAVRNNAAVIASIRGAMRKWVRRRVDLVRIPERSRRRHPEPVPLVRIEVVDLAGLPDRAAFTPRTALEDEVLERIESEGSEGSDGEA